MQSNSVKVFFLVMMIAGLLVLCPECRGESNITCETNFTAKEYDLVSLSQILLGHPDSYARQKAVESLGKMGDPRALEALIAALDDKSRHVRQSAADVLIQFDEPAVDSLINALKDENCRIRTNAARVLGEMNDPRAVDPLIAALKDTYWKVRAEAAEALGKLNDPRAVAPLVAARTDEDYRVKWKAADAVSKITREHAIHKQKPAE